MKVLAVTGGARGIGRAVAKLGCPDALVNNAGIGKPDDIADACFYLVEQAGFMTVKMIYEE